MWAHAELSLTVNLSQKAHGTTWGACIVSSIVKGLQFTLELKDANLHLIAALDKREIYCDGNSCISHLWWLLLLLFSHSVLSNFFVTPWTVARQAPLSTRFPRQEYWSGLHFLLRNLPDPGIEPMAPAFQVDSLSLNHQWSTCGG